MNKKETTIELTFGELLRFARTVANHQQEDLNRAFKLYPFQVIEEEPKLYYDLAEELWDKKRGK